MHAALHKAWLALLFSSLHRREERERKERERDRRELREYPLDSDFHHLSHIFMPNDSATTTFKRHPLYFLFPTVSISHKKWFWNWMSTLTR